MPPSNDWPGDIMREGSQTSAVYQEKSKSMRQQDCLLQRDRYSARPSVRVSKPASRAFVASGGNTRGISRRAMMVDAQYAPLDSGERRFQIRWAQEYHHCSRSREEKQELTPAQRRARICYNMTTYRTSSSPPSVTLKPPSACLSRPSHRHLDSQGQRLIQVHIDRRDRHSADLRRRASVSPSGGVSHSCVEGMNGVTHIASRSTNAKASAPPTMASASTAA